MSSCIWARGFSPSKRPEPDPSRELGAEGPAGRLGSAWTRRAARLSPALLAGRGRSPFGDKPLLPHTGRRSLSASPGTRAGETERRRGPLPAPSCFLSPQVFRKCKSRAYQALPCLSDGVFAPLLLAALAAAAGWAMAAARLEGRRVGPAFHHCDSSRDAGAPNCPPQEAHPMAPLNSLLWSRQASFPVELSPGGLAGC